MEFGFKENRGGRYKWLLQYPLSAWKGWVFILILTLLTTAFNLLQPWPLKILVDHVFKQQPISASLARIQAWVPGAVGEKNLLLGVALAGLVIFAVNSTLDLILTFSWIRVGQRMVYDLMRDVFARVQRQSLLFHSQNMVGDLMSRVTGDSWCIHTITDTLLFAPLHALVTIIAMVIVMLQINPKLTLISFILAPLMTVASLFFGKRIRKVTHQKRQSESHLQSHLHQTLNGILTVQAFVQEEREQHRFKDFARAAIGAQKQSTLTGSIYQLAVGGVSAVGSGLILYLGAQQVISGQLTVGGLLIFLSYLNTLQGQLKAFTGIYSTLQSAGASVDRINEIYDVAQEVRNEPSAAPLPLVAGMVQFERVTVGYEPGRAVLKEVSFAAQPGQTLAIVGATGAGKSTLVSLVPRFFDPWQGRVLIDGHDVREVELKSLRQQIGIVLQEPFLFPLSIAENIAYGKPEAARQEIEAAARAANAHQFIERLPQGYETVIGERGATLSGGERQRLSIARALLKDAPILILDEPTSALDAQTEQLLLEALERLMRGRTTFIIAHRLSTIRGADQIVVLEEGRIVEMGSHEELLQRRGRYATLYQIQFGNEVQRTIKSPVG